MTWIGRCIVLLEGRMKRGHAHKNLGGQLASPVRCIVVGSYFVDSSAARANGLPFGAWARDEPMSDYLNCLLFNPYFCIPEAAP